MYRIPDLQYFQLKSLDIDWSVYIKLPSCTIKYIVEMTDGYYLKNCTKYTENEAIFTALGIDSPRIFVMNIVGYECSGAFPEVKTKEDLLKVIVALDKECIKRFGDKNKQSEFKDGDYLLTFTESKQKESEKVNLFLTKRHYKLNFSIN